MTHAAPGARAPADRREAVHGGVRVTAAAAAGFYGCLYGLDRPVMALYALFGAVAMGLLARIPGSGRQRAAVLLVTLPLGWVLVSAGTLLAVHTWSAVAGMAVVGFCLAFAAVAGPRAAGAAPGLQLLYILPSFPPYEPGTLWERLVGYTLGALLLTASERFLLPVPPPGATYRGLLADAAALAGTAAEQLSAVPPAGPQRGTTPDELAAAGERLRPSQVPPAERPASAARTDRALSHAAGAVRALLGQLAAMIRAAPPGAGRRPDPACAALLTAVADACARTASAARHPSAPSPYGAHSGDPPELRTAVERFQQARADSGAADGGRPPAEVLRRRTAVLAAAQTTRILAAAVDVARGGRRPRPLFPDSDLFSYADAGALALWRSRVQGHLTRSSVQFQNAVRITLGLCAARLVAGAFDIEHGFWVLLAVLTLGRSTAVETWSTVRSALLGTFAGALAAAVLIIGAGPSRPVYAALLAPVMLTAFAAGALFGPAWGQALFTLVVSVAFAQLAPVTWQLAETRLLDVVTGSVIGLACSLLAWPAGARRETVRSMGRLLHTTALLLEETTAEVLRPPADAEGPPPSTLAARHALRLAEASFAQYQSEPRSTAREGPHPDFHAVDVTARQILLGAHWLPYDICSRDGGPGPRSRTWARQTAAALAGTCTRLGDRLLADRPPKTPPPEPAEPAGPPDPDDPALPVLLDLDVWFTGVRSALAPALAAADRPYETRT
ncbi:FUSC family protein [Streptomyces sp. MUM 178J]|uniref:FUSC family protein n=1 Tax=Streptomyces sp. MUM 178J TaxID=2791991 RepID=UPI001F04CD11|nr:FUSC family protein [Streptomyces sp. MUM 178J]WRQ78037.1 FUSC family protein [Streptomyces sp. MUM 178J]